MHKCLGSTLLVNTTFQPSMRGICVVGSRGRETRWVYNQSIFVQMKLDARETLHEFSTYCGKEIATAVEQEKLQWAQLLKSLLKSRNNQHDIMVSGDVGWCAKCGSYITPGSYPKGLRYKCTGTPLTSRLKSQRESLRMCIHPKKKIRLGQTHRIDFADFLG